MDTLVRSLNEHRMMGKLLHRVGTVPSIFKIHINKLMTKLQFYQSFS